MNDNARYYMYNYCMYGYSSALFLSKIIHTLYYTIVGIAARSYLPIKNY